MQVARRIDAVTGGLGLNAQARMRYGKTGQGCLPLIQVTAKCLTRNIDPMYAIVEELIGQVDFGDSARLKQLIGEYRSALEAMIIHNGHRLAISLSARHFSPAAALSEMWSGVHQIRTIRQFSNEMNDDRIDKLAVDLAAIGKAVFTSDNLVMAAIGEADTVDAAAKRISQSPVLGDFQGPHANMNFAPLDLKLDAALPYEGWSTSSAVAFVAQTLPTIRLGHPDAPVLSVLAKLLRSHYLHREIREKGGAYGGFALYNPENGMFSLASYRDPHIVQTLNVYAATAAYTASAPLTDENIHEAILQVCSEIDKPDPPGPAARRAFMRLVVGLSDEARRAHKAQLLKVTKAQVLDAAANYFGNARDTSATVVISGHEQLEAANRKLGDRPLTLQTI